ncbi:7558_t:CDS:1 [Paraglomus brasilianum]|uniref:Post-GPI attachment to proteins factor 3 n=1 Tax=Paraglomus brasilianum TaxID=144538 RepID=A0A9N9BE24_9GLOM|nr:7558_t:CDS:1 [Paraglomus brasilianum]
MNPICLVAILILLVGCTQVYSSEGDNSKDFKNCVSLCSSATCPRRKIPPIRRLLQWSCENECEYECMQEITETAKESGGEILQYHGKWPFVRLWGMQEPASVLFSALNGYMHYQYISVFKRQIADGYYMKKFYVWCCYIGVNSWIWSVIYHSRDFVFTERMDYFAAGLAVLYSLYTAGLRVLHIRKTFHVASWTFVCLVAYTLHISYLLSGTFDYRYNMIANVAVASINNVLWFYWTIMHWNKRPDDAWKPAATGALVSLFLSLELFDFPPILGIFDAHSLWHLSTIPVIPFWYNFLLVDAEREDHKERKGKKTMK